MGAHNAHAEFDGTLTHKQLEEKYNSYIDQLVTEYGTDPYNGTLSTCHGLIISDKKFDTVEEAERYGLDNTEKWEAAMAVWCKNVIKVRTNFTFDGKGAFDGLPIQSAWTVSTPSAVKVADQLTATEGKRLIKLYTAEKEAKAAHRSAESVVRPMIDALTNAEGPLAPDHFATLKRESAKLRLLRDKHKKALAKLQEDVQKLTAKYIKEEVKQDKPLWVVSGWAAC